MSYSQVLRFGWEKLKAHWKLLAVYMLVLILFNAVTGFIGSGLENVSSALAMVFNILITIAGLFVGIAQIKLILRIVDGNASNDLKAELTVFKEFLARSAHQVLPYFLASFAYALLVIVGLILLIVPGIVFAIKYQYVMYLVVDKGMGVKEAFRVSGEITQGKKLWLLGFGFVSGILVLLGLIALIIPGIIVAGVVTIGSMYIYRQLSSATAIPTPAKLGEIA
jgi:hypothetical protein